MSLRCLKLKEVLSLLDLIRAFEGDHMLVGVAVWLLLDCKVLQQLPFFYVLLSFQEFNKLLSIA
jgi:hypothetical protein